MGSNISNGRIKINDGEGISGAILREAGITSAEDKAKLNKSGAWNSIFKLVNDQQTKATNGDEGYEFLYDKNSGDDLNGPSNKNYVVHKGSTLNFAKDIWEKILDVINKALNKTGDNALKYDAAAQANDTVNNSGNSSGADKKVKKENTPPLSKEQQAAVDETKEHLDTALKGTITHTPQHSQTGNKEIVAHTYESLDKNGNKIIVTTDPNGKPTEVEIWEPNAETAKVMYNLDENTISIDGAEETKLSENHLKAIKEKAFLIANNVQITDAKKTATEIIKEFNDKNSKNTEEVYLLKNGKAVFRLKDGRSIIAKLDDQNNITEIQILSHNKKDDDKFADITFRENGFVFVDRDGKFNTKKDNQEITLSDTRIFEDLKKELEQVVKNNKETIANLKAEQADKT